MAKQITLEDIDALTNDSQAQAALIVGVEYIQLIKSFKSYSQVRALRILMRAKPDKVQENTEQALLFVDDYNVEMLEALDGQHPELALQGTEHRGYMYHWSSFLRAARLLKHSSNVHLLYKFGDLYTVEALDILGADKAECALHFSTDGKVKLLERAMPNFDCGTVAEPVVPAGEQSDTEGGNL